MAKFSWLSSLASLTYLSAITSGQPDDYIHHHMIETGVVNKVGPTPTLPEMVDDPGVSYGALQLIFKDILYSTIKSDNLIF